MRVSNLCAEMTSRLFYLMHLWHNAIKALCHRSNDPKEKTMFSELVAKINVSPILCLKTIRVTSHRSHKFLEYIISLFQIQKTSVQENFQIFFCSLAALNCLVLQEFTILIVRTCVLASPHCK
jgi:hypothetical protein